MANKLTQKQKRAKAKKQARAEKATKSAKHSKRAMRLEWNQLARDFPAEFLFASLLRR